MPDYKYYVINTGPIIALTAAVGNLNILRKIYSSVLVPEEVVKEILYDNSSRFAADEFQNADWLEHKKITQKSRQLPFSSLDPGESSVIQLALETGIMTVCIDEIIGRRIARLCGLKVTGSLGILLRAKREGINISIRKCISNMKKKGINISLDLQNYALKEAGELE